MLLPGVFWDVCAQSFFHVNVSMFSSSSSIFRVSPKVYTYITAYKIQILLAQQEVVIGMYR